VRGALLLLAAASVFTGLQLLRGSDAVSPAVTGFLGAHATYSVVMAANLLRQRQIVVFDARRWLRWPDSTHPAG
jgi:hypothetical protein